MADIETGSTTSITDDVHDLGEDSELGEVTPPKGDKSNLPAEEDEDDDEPVVTDEEDEEIDDKIDDDEDANDDEELPETTHPFDRPSLKSVEEKFPGLLKTFPALRDMYFREAEYSKLFPTVDEAKEANENHIAFTNIKEDVFNGDGAKFFAAIKEVDEKSLEKFSGQVLGTLFKVSPNSFWRAANPLVEDIARNMYNKGVRENDENLQNSALHLSNYFFGNTDIAEGKKTTIPKIEQNDEVKKEREQFDNEKATAFSSVVENDVRSRLVKLVEGYDSKTEKSRLDPDGVFSDFIKSTIIDRVIDDLGKQLTADKNHIRYMDSLWASSKKNGRTDADKARIISAYLARAKSLIPSLRGKYVSEAMGHKQKVASGKKKIVQDISDRPHAGAIGRGSNGREKSYNPKHINYSKSSDADIINDNITYK